MHKFNEVKSNPKQPSYKKCEALKKAIVKKDVKSKMAAKKWQIAKKKNDNLQCKFTQIIIIKIFAISLPSQPSLGHHFVFPISFTM